MEQIMPKKHNDLLKVIAIITMLIDHIGLVFFPQYTILRMIGRIALPIFSYQLAIGYRYTSNKNKYMSRLWVFALLSQIPYMLLFDSYDLNVLFTLLFSIFLMVQLHKGRGYWLPIGLIIVIVPEYFAAFPDFNYHWYGLLAPLLFYWFHHHKGKILLSQALLLFVYVGVGEPMIQVFAIIGVILCLYLPKDTFKITLNKYFFYWFYPVHLLLLFIIMQIIYK